MPSSPAKLDVAHLRIQNLRGFDDATLLLESPTLFLVGPNNAGKTSLLKLLDVVFNRDLDRDFVKVSDELLEVLLPARDTRNRARRLTVGVRVEDGRRHKSLQCRDGIAELRLSLTVSDRRLRANLGPPVRGEAHDSKAAGLLSELREAMAYVHIPAGRSVDSGGFSESLAEAMTESLLATVRQPGKGATREERAAKRLVGQLEKIAGPIDDFWQAFLDRLPPGWVISSSASSKLDREVIAEFLVEQFDLRLATGDHDSDGVSPSEVGSGLQSLLDLELRRQAAESLDQSLFLGIEEPEVFLHPSAQRHYGRLLSQEELGTRAVVSTHSSLFVEEASFEQVAVVRDHQFHQPRVSDETRASINTVLMTGRGAEVFFAKSVLLVEGPGDREYWESLRRRLARHDPSGAVDHCFVVDVGANSRFAPWFRLLRSYAPNPFRWVAILDCDSVSEVRRAFTDAGLAWTSRQATQLDAVRDAVRDGELSACEVAARKLGRVSAGENAALLAPGDLEHVMCGGLDDEAAAHLAQQVGLDAQSGADLAEKLGTKHRAGGVAVDGSRKDPWMRALLGHETPSTQLDPFVGQVLKQWLSGVLDGPEASAVVEDFLAGAEPD